MNKAPFFSPEGGSLFLSRNPGQAQRNRLKKQLTALAKTHLNIPSTSYQHF